MRFTESCMSIIYYILVQDHTKALNTLMSNSAPIVKKRQVMRLSFGDYRAKMAADEQKNSKSNNLNTIHTII